MGILATPYFQNPWPKGHEFHNFGKGLNAQYNHATVWLLDIQDERFLKIALILVVFAPPLRTRGLGGTMEFIFLFPFSHRCYRPKMVETYKHAQSRPLSTFAKIVVYVYDELIISYCRIYGQSWLWKVWNWHLNNSRKHKFININVH